MLTDPAPGDLGPRRRMLQADWQSEGADPCAPATSNTLAAVQEAINEALRQSDPDQAEATRQLIPVALDSWSQACETGITITVVIG
jgi:hypothetical protein